METGFAGDGFVCKVFLAYFVLKVPAFKFFVKALIASYYFLFFHSIYLFLYLSCINP